MDARVGTRLSAGRAGCSAPHRTSGDGWWCVSGRLWVGALCELCARAWLGPSQVRELRGLFEAYLEQMQSLSGPDVEASMIRWGRRG